MQPNTSTHQYILRDEDSSFQRGSVEAAPDSLPDTIFTPSGTFDYTGSSVSASLTR